MNHRRHGLSSHEVAIPTDSSDPSSQESTSGGPCVVMHAVLRCAVPLATETGLAPFCRRGFGAKTNRSTRSHHTGQADATSSKEGHHEKEGTKTPSQEFGGLDGRAFGLESFGDTTQNRHQGTEGSHHDGWPNTHPKRGLPMVEHSVPLMQETNPRQRLVNHLFLGFVFIRK